VQKDDLQNQLRAKKSELEEMKRELEIERFESEIL
jgi:hypothetical protein